MKEALDTQITPEDEHFNRDKEQNFLDCYHEYVQKAKLCRVASHSKV